MTPFEWAMIIMTALSVGNQMMTENTQDTEDAAPGTGGPDPKDLEPVIGGAPTGGSVGEILDGVAMMDGPATAAAQAAATTPPEPVQPPTPVPSPTDTPEPGMSGAEIGKILMAAPGALEAVSGLLGFNAQDTRTQRPAPAAGGTGGQVVGQFGRQMGSGTDLGRLLAALPGIR